LESAARGSAELGPDPGRGREPEIAARDDRLASAVAFELLGLAPLRASVDRFRVEQSSQLR